MSLTSLAIKIAMPIPKIESFERFLFVGPHPDDIEIGAGATIAKLARENKSITFLICTDGRFGDGASNGVKGDALAALRKEECIKSAAILGVKDVRFLDLRDGAGYDIDELRKGIAEVISDVKPDVVFGPDPMSKSESHLDHLNVGNACKNVVCFAPYSDLMKANYGVEGAPVKAVAFYMTNRPNSFVKTHGFVDLQLKSIFDCHLSQYPKNSGDAKAISLYIKLRSAQYGLRHFSTAAEGFRVYPQGRMHCVPEAE